MNKLTHKICKYDMQGNLLSETTPMTKGMAFGRAKRARRNHPNYRYVVEEINLK